MLVQANAHIEGQSLEQAEAWEPVGLRHLSPTARRLLFPHNGQEVGTSHISYPSSHVLCSEPTLRGVPSLLSIHVSCSPGRLGFADEFWRCCGERCQCRAASFGHSPTAGEAAVPPNWSEQQEAQHWHPHELLVLPSCHPKPLHKGCEQAPLCGKGVRCCLGIPGLGTSRGHWPRPPLPLERTWEGKRSLQP